MHDQPKTRYGKPAAEAFAATSLACILTLAFMSPLHTAGRASICIFAVALPFNIAVVLLEHIIENRFRTRFPALLELIRITGIVLTFFGLLALVYDVYAPAAIILIVSTGIAAGGFVACNWISDER